MIDFIWVSKCAWRAGTWMYKWVFDWVHVCECTSVWLSAWVWMKEYLLAHGLELVNSLRPGALHVHQWTGSSLTHWGQDKMAAIFQMTFSNVFCWMFKLTVFQHWFWQWLGTGQATSHYLNQWWPSILTHICVTWPQWVNINWAIKNKPEKHLN